MYIYIYTYLSIYVWSSDAMNLWTHQPIIKSTLKQSCMHQKHSCNQPINMPLPHWAPVFDMPLNTHWRAVCLRSNPNDTESSAAINISNMLWAGTTIYLSASSYMCPVSAYSYICVPILVYPTHTVSSGTRKMSNILSAPTLSLHNLLSIYTAL